METLEAELADALAPGEGGASRVVEALEPGAAEDPEMAERAARARLPRE